MADEQRSERATQRRREKALESGQLVRSRELPSALTLLGVAAFFRWGQADAFVMWRDLLRHLLVTASRGETANMGPLLNWTAADVLRSAAPPLAIAWCVSAFGLLTQGGFVVTPLAFQPHWDRLNPANNIARIFSLGGLSPLLKSLIPVTILLYIAVGIVSREWIQLIHSSQMGISAALPWLFSLLYEFSWKGGMVLLVWAGADYGIQKMNYERSIRMTKQEVREEAKDLQGNPANRGRIRRRQREMRRRLMLRQVARATVVITNPDEFAVALEYVPQKMAAPVVVAKGRGAIAQKIKREARWYEIPMVENRPLAQALYRTVEIGGTIPAKLYMAVAEVLAFIYRAQARMRSEAEAKTKATREQNSGGASPAGAGRADQQGA